MWLRVHGRQVNDSVQRDTHGSVCRFHVDGCVQRDSVGFRVQGLHAYMYGCVGVCVWYIYMGFTDDYYVLIFMYMDMCGCV